MLKTKPKKGASTDAELFDIVVCQVDHRIVCQAWGSGGGRSGSGRGGRRLLEAETRRKKSPCKTTKWVKPVARCVNFDAAVWNAGPTCIANLAHKDAHPQCSDKIKRSTKSKVKKLCRKANKADNGACASFRARAASSNPQLMRDSKLGVLQCRACAFGELSFD